MDLTANLQTEIKKLANSPEVPEWVMGRVQKLISDLQNQAEETLRQRDQEIKYQNAKIEKLVLELAYLRRMRYGAKSEALAQQMDSLFEPDLFAETLESDMAAAEAELARHQSENTVTSNTTTNNPAKRQRAGRQALPAHLPRIEHRHEPESCTCGQCGKDLVKIGEDISEPLDVKPPEFFVRRHIRPQYACRSCETVKAAPIPPAIIDGGMAAVGLQTWVLICKFLDHMPLYRIEQMGARQGVILARSTLAQLVGQVRVALNPLFERLIELLLMRSTLHADETPVKQLDHGKGKTHRAYMWAYRSNTLDTGPPIVVLDYQTSRSGAHASQFLANWQGSLMVDDYSGYKKLFAAGVVELACWAHARRKFFDLNNMQPNRVAQEALKWIAQLYAIEQAAKEMSVEERGLLRQREALPLLNSLHSWMIATRVKVADGGGTARALDYSLKRWPALIRYAHDGSLPIDQPEGRRTPHSGGPEHREGFGAAEHNNLVENAIRPICLGKKNWLFVSSQRAGERAAVIQSLLATASLNGLDPAAWLRETLEKLPTCLNRDFDSLLPLRNCA